MQMPTEKGLVDDLFIHELCLALHMSRRQLGEAMDVHELTVLWPEYYAALERERKREEDAQQSQPRSRRFQG